MARAGTGGVSSARAMGATMRTLRDRVGLSQVALGARIAMHPNYLGTLERGGVRNPGLETIDRVARGIGVSIAVLAESYASPRMEGVPPGDASGGGRTRTRAGVEDGAEALGEAIRLVRRLRGLTQAQLADAAALHRSHLVSIEAGERRNPGIGTVGSVARGLASDADAAPLLPLLAQTFAGELTVADLRGTVAAESDRSGPSSDGV